jgi:hypothetical protein
MFSVSGDMNDHIRIKNEKRNSDDERNGDCTTLRADKRNLDKWH